MLLEKSSPLFPFQLFVTQYAEGVPGLAPTLAIRDVISGEYFDFDDNTFKSSGWVDKFATMTDDGGGNYHTSLPIASVAAITVGMFLAAEYPFDDGGIVVGDSVESYEVVRLIEDASIARKVVSNRKKEVAGNPGTLTIYDDDGTTPFIVGDLTDATGGAVTAAAGAPAEFVPQ